MLTTFIKFLFTYFFCIYICARSLPTFKYSFISQIIFSCILSISTALLNIYAPSLRYTFPILILWLISSIRNSSPKFSFIAITISFSLSYCFHSILNFIVLFTLLPFFRNYANFTQLALITGVVQSFSILKLLSIKRFRKGIPFMLSLANSNLAVFISLLIIFFSMYMTNEYTSFNQHLVALLSFSSLLLTLAFLIYWWQAQITKAYRRNLELRELESMRTEMAELKRKMEELVNENERLARITHRDNTLISALKNSTIKYLSTDFDDPAVALETRNQLIENINTLSAGRSSLPETRKVQNARTFDTGFSLLNELLHEMDEKAIEMKIIFAVHMGTSLDAFIPDAISESDLVHTVDDLLKNAFKATATCEKRMVQLQFYKLGKHFVLEVSDSGIPFEIRSLVNMGIEKLTTYEDGSGIGLMDIWSTKEKYGATYHLDECVNSAPFSKKISLTFDKKNRYSIRTLRKDEILQMSRRADLQVYDYNE